MKINDYYSSKKKRLFDLSLAILITFLLIPFALFLYPLLIITIGKPVLFKQKRLGKNKKPFVIYKLRTMDPGAEKKQKGLFKNNQAPSPMFKIHDDPRFVGIGKILSKFGIDEMPQIINILLGEMSFIGPRPLPIEEAKKLPKTWDYRYLVNPGIISDWALSDERFDSLNKWQQLEKKSLKEKSSILVDIKTIFRLFKMIANIAKQQLLPKK